MAISLQADGALPQGYILVDGQRVASVSTTGGLSATLAANTVTTSALVDSSVTTEKIAPGAVTTSALVDSSVTTEKIAPGAVTAAKMSGEQTGSAPVYGCRAWVNFDGFTADNINGTYSRTGTTVTVNTTVDHNVKVGHAVTLDFTSGAAADGTFTVATVPSSTQFTVIHVGSTTTSGNVTLLRRLIRASGNVANVTYLDTGRYVVNFTTAMSKANQCVLTSVSRDSAVGGKTVGVESISTSSCLLETRTANGGQAADATIITVAVFDGP